MAERAATIAEVRARLGPAFTDPPITDEVVQMYLDDTQCFVAVSVFGDCASQAHAYAAAHCIAGSPYASAIEGDLFAGQLVASASDGPASYSFGIPSLEAGDAPWNLTSWGRKFLEYRLARWGKGSALVARTSRTRRRRCC